MTIVSTTSPAFAAGRDAQSADLEFSFDMPALPLESALADFGAKTGFQVLYETVLTVRRRSHEVKGNYTADVALRLLLSGTGLSFGYIEDGAFTLLEAPHRRDRGIADFREYLGVVQGSLMAALCQRGETRPGSYNVAMQFSIARTGRIENPRLLNSTGVESRDDAFVAAISRLTVGQSPPADMPQPVTMVLKSDARGARECQQGR